MSKLGHVPRPIGWSAERIHQAGGPSIRPPDEKTATSTQLRGLERSRRELRMLAERREPSRHRDLMFTASW